MASEDKSRVVRDSKIFSKNWKNRVAYYPYFFIMCELQNKDGESMENINKYIGIKHKFNGDTFDGADCIGLCRLFYREHGWPETFTDGRIIEHDWESKEPLRLLLYLRKYFDENKDISRLRFGDIVLFNIGGDSHLGIYLEYGKVLAMQAPVQEGKTISTLYPRSLWQHSFKAGFRRR